MSTTLSSETTSFDAYETIEILGSVIYGLLLSRDLNDFFLDESNTTWGFAALIDSQNEKIIYFTKLDESDMIQSLETYPETKFIYLYLVHGHSWKSRLIDNVLQNDETLDDFISNTLEEFLDDL